MANKNPQELLGATPQSSFNAFPVADVPIQLQGTNGMRLLNNGGTWVDKPTIDGTQQLLNKIGSNSEDDANPLLKYINVNDFINSAAPDGLTNADYYPGQALSPVKVEASQGSRWNNLPQITGGQVLIPFGLQDARKKALQDAAAKKATEDVAKKTKEGDFDMWKQLQGKPALQPRVDKFYQEKIMTPFSEGYDKYGEFYTNMITPGTDMFDPKEYNKYTSAYNEYQAYTSATKVLDTAIENYRETQKTNPNFIIDKDTEELMRQYDLGFPGMDDKETFNRVMTLSKTLDTRYTLDQLAPAYKEAIGSRIASYFDDVRDAAGNPIAVTQANKKQILAYIEQKSSQDLDGLVNEIAKNPNLGMEYRDKAEIKAWLKAFVDTGVSQKFEQLSYPQQTVINNGGDGSYKKQPYVVPVKLWNEALDPSSPRTISVTTTTTPVYSAPVARLNPKTNAKYTQTEIDNEVAGSTGEKQFGNTYYRTVLGHQKVKGGTEGTGTFFNKFDGVDITVGKGQDAQGNIVLETATLSSLELRDNGKWYIHFRQDEQPLLDESGKDTGGKTYGEGEEVKELWGFFHNLAEADRATSGDYTSMQDYWQANKTQIMADKKALEDAAIAAKKNKGGTPPPKQTAPPPPKTTTPPPTGTATYKTKSGKVLTQATIEANAVAVKMTVDEYLKANPTLVKQ